MSLLLFWNGQAVGGQTIQQSLAASVFGVPVLSDAATYRTALSVPTSGTPSLMAIRLFLLSLAAAASGSGAAARQIWKPVSRTVSGSATMSDQLALSQRLASAVSATWSLLRPAQFAQDLPLAVVGGGSILLAATFRRVLGAAASVVGSVLTPATRVVTLAVQVATLPLLGFGRLYVRVLDAIASGGASLLNTFQQWTAPVAHAVRGMLGRRRRKR